MGSLFGGKKPKVDAGLQRSQRKQEKNISDQTAEEAQEAGGRRRLQQAKRSGAGTLFQQTGGAGVKSTLG